MSAVFANNLSTQRRSLLSGLLLHNKDVVYVVDTDSCILFCSHRWRQFTTSSRTHHASLTDNASAEESRVEIVGQPLASAIGEPLACELVPLINRTLGGYSGTMPVPMRSERFPFQADSINLTPLADDAGVWGVMLSFVETQDKPTGAATMPCQWDGGAANSVEIFWELDTELKLSAVGYADNSQSAASIDWQVGKSLREVILKACQADDAENIQLDGFDRNAFNNCMLALQEHRAIDNYIWARKTDEGMRWMCINAQPLFSKGVDSTFIGYAGISQDFTGIRSTFIEHSLLNRVVNSISTGIAVFDRENNLVQYNQGLQKILNLSRVDLRIGQYIEELLYICARTAMPASKPTEVNALIKETMSRWDAKSSKHEWRDSQGNWLRFDSERTEDGLLFVQVREINAQKSVERQLASERNLLSSLLASMEDAVYAVDTNSKFILANEAAAFRFNTHSVDSLIGLSQLDCLPAVDAKRAKRDLSRVIESRQPLIDQEIRYTHPVTGEIIDSLQTRTPLIDEKNKVVGVVAHEKDVSRYHDLIKKLSFQAENDALTGLVNRRGFDIRIEEAIENYTCHGEMTVLCYLDLDQFKIVNDTVGHHAGDELLRQVAQLLLSSIRESDTLARLGGDEFGIVFCDCELEEALVVVRKMLADLQQYRFQWDDKMFEIGASVGAVELANNNLSASELLSCADVACYEAKDQGRGRVSVFSDNDENSIQRRHELEWAGDIGSAIEEGRFVLYMQPIARVINQELQIHHYEALVRMLSRDGEMIPPGVFIPAAERYELMGGVDRWVVAEVLGSYRQTFGQDSSIMVAINLSGNSLNDPALTDYVKTELQKSRVNASAVCFELTETALISNLAVAQSFVKEIAALGCSFALDDFGSGLSSFGYLKNFDINFLKIDGGFVRNMIDDSTDHAMVTAIHSIGRTLGIETIAEFVETDAHIRALTEIGVDYLQGYGVARPVSLENLAEELANARDVGSDDAQVAAG